MVRLSLLSVLSALLALPAAASPIADVICDATPRMRDRLTTQFGNRQEATGIRSPEQIMEVWTGPRGDWTLVMTYADGKSCIVAMGENWQQTQKDPT